MHEDKIASLEYQNICKDLDILEFERQYFRHINIIQSRRQMTVPDASHHKTKGSLTHWQSIEAVSSSGDSDSLPLFISEDLCWGLKLQSKSPLNRYAIEYELLFFHLCNAFSFVLLENSVNLFAPINVYYHIHLKDIYQTKVWRVNWNGIVCPSVRLSRIHLCHYYTNLFSNIKY